MSEIKTLDPEKLKAARGQRTQEEIAARSNGAFTAAQISGYENGLYLPKVEKWPLLVAALGVSFDDVSTALPVPDLKAA